MKQILQSLKTGEIELADVPCPMAGPGQLLIRSHRSLVSLGTESMLIEFGKAGWISKARQQPDKVKQVLEKVRTDGLMPTVEAVFNKLDQPLPLGYCNVGTVISVGAGVTGFKVGDRVASNGKHAEVVAVPVNLCARVPDDVSDDEAAFTVLGAIALQGIRLVQPTLGEAVVVTGLGLIGLVAVQLLRAQGCRVLGLDFDPRKLALARQFGAETVNLAAGEDPVAAAQIFSRGRGIDAVIITAATQSDEPMHQAAQMCRKRGRIVLVGVTGLNLSRADFFEKELTFQVSCSYGPGRYDPTYEDKGQDYPVGFVRWTEQRNFEAVLDMLGSHLDVATLITHRFALDDAKDAYGLIGGAAAPLGILLTYPEEAGKPLAELTRRTTVLNPAGSGKAVLGFIGAGNYATAVLAPAFKTTSARLKSIASRAGVTGFHAGRKHGFEETATDVGQLLADPAINGVVIATQHNNHAAQVQAALGARKHVFVEKPLALTLEDMDAVDAARNEAIASGFSPIIAVGFNRRFAPQVLTMKKLLGAVSGPKSMVMTVNAGAIPGKHWTQDQDSGGGRIAGEACHFIDLLRFLAGVPILRVGANAMTSPHRDTASIELAFADGSIGTIHYFANGSKSFPKERVEVFAGGAILQLDNFRKLNAFGWPKFKGESAWRQDKGQKNCAAAFVRAVEQGGAPPMPYDEMMEVSRATIEAANLVRKGGQA